MSFFEGPSQLGDKDRLALAAASQASYAASEIVRCLHEHGGLPDDLVEKLLDAAKMVMEVDGDFQEERGQVYAAICKFLEGWV